MSEHTGGNSKAGFNDWGKVSREGWCGNVQTGKAVHREQDPRGQRQGTSRWGRQKCIGNRRELLQ